MQEGGGAEGGGAGAAVVGVPGGGAGKKVKRRWRVKRVPKAPALKEKRVDWKMYRMRGGKGGKGPYEYRVWRGDMSKKWRCEHGRHKFVCRDCGGASICHHDRVRSTCKVHALLPPPHCTLPRPRSRFTVRRTAAAAASACTSGSAPSARSAAAAASAFTSGFAPRARSAAAAASACTSGGDPRARSAAAAASACTSGSATTAGTAAARASASTASGATGAPASTGAS